MGIFGIQGLLGVQKGRLYQKVPWFKESIEVPKDTGCRAHVLYTYTPHIRYLKILIVRLRPETVAL